MISACHWSYFGNGTCVFYGRKCEKSRSQVFEILIGDRSNPEKLLREREMAELLIKQAELYNEARPSYPPELFEFIASKTPCQDLAWDVGTGSGQAARSFSFPFPLSSLQKLQHLVADGLSRLCHSWSNRYLINIPKNSRHRFYIIHFAFSADSSFAPAQIARRKL